MHRINPSKLEDPSAQTDLTANFPASDQNSAEPNGMADLRHSDELDPEVLDILEEVDRRLDAAYSSHRQYGRLDFCRVIWAEKKRILFAEYGIDWKSPDE